MFKFNQTQNRKYNADAAYGARRVLNNVDGLPSYKKGALYVSADSSVYTYGKKYAEYVKYLQRSK
jgi:hypothetical protein